MLLKLLHELRMFYVAKSSLYKAYVLLALCVSCKDSKAACKA